jgi:2',3'-cyclic-nucleotide 2'-phosphodiesterase (5'-nucleotidase family)
MSCKSKLGDTEIVILSLNDIHGKFDNLARVSAFIKETKKNHKHVIVVNAGDFFTGNPYSDLYEQRQYPIVDLMNTMGVDVSVIGNHEFDFGSDLLHNRLHDANFASVAANIETKNTVLEHHVQPYHIIEKGGVKVKFLGLINVDSRTKKTTAIMEHVANVVFYDPYETAEKYKHLKRNVSVFVGLTHLGVEEDRKLADLMPEFDLIIGGHSHTLIERTEVRNGVTILQANRHARYIDKTTIFLKKGEVVNIINEMIEVANLTDEDPIVVSKVLGYEDNEFLKTPFATLENDLEDEEQLGNLFCDAALSLHSVDFSVMNCGSIRQDYLKAGPISYADVLRIYPFSNHLVIISFKPAELREFIEVEHDPQRTCLMHVGGFHYTLLETLDDKEKVVYKAVSVTYPDGRPLDENKLYRVVMNNYLSSRYLSDHQVSKTNVTPIFVLDNIVDFLKHNPNISYQNTPKRAHCTYLTTLR